MSRTYTQTFHGNKKNYAVIEKCKQVAQMKKVTKEMINGDLVHMYAAVALCLTDAKYGWSKEKIEEFILDTGYLWNECMEKDISMVEWCSQVAGIDIEDMTGAK